MNVEEKIRDAIARNKDVLIKYQKYSGEVSIRKISAIEKSEEFGSDYIFAFCRLRNEWRTFRLDRIIEIKVLDTSTPVSVPKPSKPKPVSHGYSSSRSYSSYRPTYSHSYYSSRTTKKSEGCYIATAVYGDYNHPQVMVLRGFRDDVLINSQLGRKFIHFYYRYSPDIAEKLKSKHLLNSIIRKMLDCFIKIINK